jgi:hypothetical protein
MEKLVHIIGFPIISKLIRGETVELSDVCFVPDDQLFNESKNKNFCVKFPIPQTSNTKELAATDSQQLKDSISLVKELWSTINNAPATSISFDVLVKLNAIRAKLESI